MADRHIDTKHQQNTPMRVCPTILANPPRLEEHTHARTLLLTPTPAILPIEEQYQESDNKSKQIFGYT